MIEEDSAYVDGDYKITVVLEKKEYKRMKEISTKLGMKPDSWMKHVMLSKLGAEKI
jgi:hypothetical protein